MRILNPGTAQNMRDMAKVAYEEALERCIREQQEAQELACGEQPASPARRQRRAQRRKPAKRAATASAAKPDPAASEGPCIRMKDLMHRLPPGQIIPPAMKLSLHCNPLTKGESRKQRLLVARDKESNAWSRHSVEEVRDIDLDHVVTMLEDYASAAAHTAPDALQKAPSAQHHRGIGDPQQQQQHPHHPPTQPPCVGMSQCSFRHIVDALAPPTRHPGCRGSGTLIKPSKCVTRMLPKRGASAGGMGGDTAGPQRCASAPPASAPPQQEGEEGQEGGQGRPASAEPTALPTEGVVPPPSPPRVTPVTPDLLNLRGLGGGAARQQQQEVGGEGGGGGGDGGAASASCGIRDIPEGARTRRERLRHALCVEHHNRVQRLGEQGRLPLPLETWVPQEDIDSAAAPSCLGVMAAAVHPEIARRQGDVRRLDRISSAKRKRLSPRGSVLGIPTVGEWRFLNAKLRGPVEDTAPLGGRPSDNVSLTAHERRKMPLPAHLAYRTRGGLRNF